MEALGPPLLQREPTPVLWVDPEHRPTDRVESGGQHQHVDRVLATLCQHAGGGEGFDGIFAQVDQRHVRLVVGLEVAVVQDQALGAEVVVGEQLARGLGVVNGLADLGAHELGDLIVEVLVGQDAAIAVDRQVDAAPLPHLFVALLALLGGVVGGPEAAGLERPPAASTHRLAQLLPLLLVARAFLFGERPVSGGQGVLGRSLEHGEVIRRLGDLGDGLDAG